MTKPQSRPPAPAPASTQQYRDSRLPGWLALGFNVVIAAISITCLAFQQEIIKKAPFGRPGRPYENEKVYLDDTSMTAWTTLWPPEEYLTGGPTALLTATASVCLGVSVLAIGLTVWLLWRRKPLRLLHGEQYALFALCVVLSILPILAIGYEAYKNTLSNSWSNQPVGFEPEDYVDDKWTAGLYTLEVWACEAPRRFSEVEHDRTRFKFICNGGIMSRYLLILVAALAGLLVGVGWWDVKREESVLITLKRKPTENEICEEEMAWARRI